MKVRMSELELDGFGDEIWEELRERAGDAVDKGVDLILDEARTHLVRRQGTPRTSSPAGQPPEMDSGDLMRSLEPGGRRNSKYGVRRDYGSDHPAAGVHEFGGTIEQDGTKRLYPARPYMRPAEDAVADEVDEILRDL